MLLRTYNVIRTYDGFSGSNQPIVTTQCCCGALPAIVVYTPVLWPRVPTAQTL